MRRSAVSDIYGSCSVYEDIQSVDITNTSSRHQACLYVAADKAKEESKFPSELTTTRRQGFGSPIINNGTSRYSNWAYDPTASPVYVKLRADLMERGKMPTWKYRRI